MWKKNVKRTVGTLLFAIVSPIFASVSTAQSMQEIEYTGGSGLSPWYLDISFDQILRMFSGVGANGLPGDGGDAYDGYEDYLDCVDEVAPAVQACKNAYSGTLLDVCQLYWAATGADVVRHGLKYVFKSNLGAALGVTAPYATLTLYQSCGDLADQALQWCDSTFENRAIANCLGYEY
ncbi:hypothetical protein R0137_06295 [Congregibacter brevis]|uniref:Secreted protein n=1 Tax=Congregibacter brevis TaxID=3081201 RepID=A0ABZ0IJF2_9GAMM|nr:hypothetical protein R0137_06295 [Congregibacter sp. IMCC45268]